jgi:hypothetical protein
MESGEGEHKSSDREAFAKKRSGGTASTHERDHIWIDREGRDES